MSFMAQEENKREKKTAQPPEATDLQTQPEATDLQTQPEATDLQTQPEATDLQTQPEATDLQTQPEATDLTDWDNTQVRGTYVKKGADPKD
jgi:hypothetical protein